MKLYIDKDANPSSSLRNGYLTSGQKALDPVFFGDVVKLDIHLVNELGELLADREQHSIQFLITDGTTNLISLQTLNYNGLSFSALVDFQTSELQTFLNGVEERKAIVEIQDVKSGTTKTIFQGSINLRNRFSTFQEITLLDPLEPSLVYVSEVLAPTAPSFVDAETTPATPSNILLGGSPEAPTNLTALARPTAPSGIVVVELQGTIPANPSNISVNNSPASPSNLSALSNPLQPSNLSVGRLSNLPSNLTITSSPNAPTGTIFSDYLLPWTWNGTQVHVPQAYVFEGTQDFAVLNDKIFVWDGSTLENGAPVYECSGSNCQTHATGGIERIYASSVTATTISWNLYFRNTNQSIYQTSGIGFTEENFSFYETTIAGTLGSIKFLPTNISLPDVPSFVDAEILPLAPNNVETAVVNYSQDPYFDVIGWDGYGKNIILLEPTQMAGDDWGITYPTGTILRTIGVHTLGYPIRAEDPNHPRHTPYSTGINQRTGAWNWFNVYDQGIQWQFVDLLEFDIDNHRRAIEEADLEVSGITAVSSVNGSYRKLSTITAIQDRSLDYIFDSTETGEFGIYLGEVYEKIINADCTLATSKIYLFKSYVLDENGNEYGTITQGIRWSFAETHPLYLNTLNPTQYDRETEASILLDVAITGTTHGEEDPFGQTFATELTSGSTCEPKPLRPTNVSATI